jgi:hypothetical protein
VSASNLVIDVESLKAVADSIQKYIDASKTDLETAMQGLRTAEGFWSDEDMRQLQESLSLFYSEVEDIGTQGIALMDRCDKKVEALQRLHSMNI